MFIFSNSLLLSTFFIDNTCGLFLDFLAIFFFFKPISVRFLNYAYSFKYCEGFDVIFYHFKLVNTLAKKIKDILWYTFIWNMLNHLLYKFITLKGEKYYPLCDLKRPVKLLMSKFCCPVILEKLSDRLLFLSTFWEFWLDIWKIG